MDFEGFQELIAGLATGEKNTAAEVRTLFSHIVQSIYLPGDIKEVDCSNEYIAANFTENGLGINERTGWAICNGLNGTQPRGGRTSIAYGDEYSDLGARGGSKNAVVVAHSHTVSGIKKYNNSFGTNGFYDRSQTADTAGISTESTGESGVGKNMQPYIVSLFIQKL